MSASQPFSVLVIRMSSLGDLILATAFLENLPENVVVDWVIAKEFAFVLKGHPRIRNLIVFDKKTGFSGWKQLMLSLSAGSYDEVVDLHVTLRSRLARIFTFRARHFRSDQPAMRWTTLSKTRIRFIGYTTFKTLWPKTWRPEAFWQRFARMAAQLQSAKNETRFLPPSFLPLLNSANLDEAVILQKYHLNSGEFVAIVPASRWESKEWSPFRYAEVCAKLHHQKKKILILGRVKDPACEKLVALLNEQSIPYHSALEEPNFLITALLLKNASAYLGGDTGLAHLAEAVGTRALMIFGPTRPHLGFGPWRPESVSITHSVWCSPCSKDGQICYRVADRFACLKKLPVSSVIPFLEKETQ